MLLKVTQPVFNQLYSEYRYDPYYQFELKQNDGSMLIGFDFAKLLQTQGYSFHLSHLKLRNLNFKHSNLTEVNFIDCDLSFSDFEGAELTEVVVEECLLTRCNIKDQESYSYHAQRFLEAKAEYDEDEEKLLDLDYLDAMSGAMD